ncbi:MAG: rhamnulokinase [Clostridia bacterium]|nr:rhamnulokinase [Clostridia bacterium]
MTYYLAIDIGASSGRHILGQLTNGKLNMEEIYRFENGIDEHDGVCSWNLEKLFNHVVEGIAECQKNGKIPRTIAIDTWGVDYVLLDKNYNEILPCYSYRDKRTCGMPDKVFNIIPEQSLYESTGIQKAEYNTLYQLYCDKISGKLNRAADFLMMPEYLSYKLTGVKKHEYTICSTSNLLNAKNRAWDEDIIEAIGFRKGLFTEVAPPCTSVGYLQNEIAKRVGFNAEVVFCPSHDTASAVTALPIVEDGIFISSGTWSLVGAEILSPITTPTAMLNNLANEGGIDYRYRFLKNITGMWIFQSIKKELKGAYSYDDMMKLAMQSEYSHVIDITSPTLLKPDSMINAIKNLNGLEEMSLADVLNCVYHSLASSYAKAIAEIEHITENSYSTIYIVGGGSKDIYLNTLTAKYTGKRVSAGPTECTATGNLISQMMYLNKNINLQQARSIVIDTFKNDIKYF